MSVIKSKGKKIQTYKAIFAKFANEKRVKGEYTTLLIKRIFSQFYFTFEFLPRFAPIDRGKRASTPDARRSPRSLRRAGCAARSVDRWSGALLAFSRCVQFVVYGVSSRYLSSLGLLPPCRPRREASPTQNRRTISQSCTGARNGDYRESAVRSEPAR